MNVVKILKTPFTIKLETILNKYVKSHEDITYKWVNSHAKNLHQDKQIDTGKTFKFHIDNQKFNQNYNKFFSLICKEAGLPTNVNVHCSVKKLEPKSHKIHTDSDDNLSKFHKTLCRFLIPLTNGPPTCYFDKCTPSNEFYVRYGKNSFIVTDVNGETNKIYTDTLIDLETGLAVKINNQIPNYDKLTHIAADCLNGLNIHLLAPWEVGTIHLFPFSILHSSTDHTEFLEKWMLTGVLTLK